MDPKTDTVFEKAEDGLNPLAASSLAKPGKLQKLTGTPMSKIALIALIITVIVSIIHYRKTGDLKKVIESDASTTVISQPQFGYVFMDITTNWCKPIPNELHVWTHDAHPVTKGVWWQARFDQDDGRIYNMPPSDSVSNGLKYTNGPSSVMEWRIMPGQRIDKGCFVYTRSPR